MRRTAASGRVKASTTEVIAMATTQTHTPATAELAHAGRHAAWFAVGNVVAFAVPFVGVSLLDLQHDVYYGLYFAAVLALLGAYAHFEQVDLRGLFTRNWVWSCALGAVKKAAQRCLEDGEARLVSVMPFDQLKAQGLKPGDTRDGIEFDKNMCPSRGVVDVFIEPVLPKPQVIIRPKFNPLVCPALFISIAPYHVKCTNTYICF